VLGFAFVIGAFVTSNVVTQRTARLATAGRRACPGLSSSRSRATRATSAPRRQRSIARCSHSCAAARREQERRRRDRHAPSEAITESSEFARLRDDPSVEEMARGSRTSRPKGFQLVELQESRNATLRNLEKALADLDRRMASAGGRGLRFGDNLLAGPRSSS
jgi:hypothetical protein